MQISLFLVNVWALGCALAPNFGSIIAFRILGGFSSAGGSVTLAYIADMFEPEHQGHAVAFVVLSSVGGSVLGPIVGQSASNSTRYMQSDVSRRWFPSCIPFLALELLVATDLRWSSANLALVYARNEDIDIDEAYRQEEAGRRRNAPLRCRRAQRQAYAQGDRHDDG